MRAGPPFTMPDEVWDEITYPYPNLNGCNFTAYFMNGYNYFFYSKLKFKELLDLRVHIDGLVQDCRISIANALEILQSYTKPSKCVLKTPPYTIFIEMYSVYSQWTERNHRNGCNIFKESFKYLSRVSIVYFLISFTLHSLSWIDMHIQDRRRFLTYFLSKNVCKTPFAIVLMNHYCVTFWGGCEISSSSDAEKATRFMVALHMFVHHRVPWTLLSEGYPMVMVKWEKWF